ncbi:MAG: right-handed parallel beta-helix repeat-containing protein, partial [Planctomycetota bacterium]
QGAGRGFYFHSGEDANSVLNGLKITNGYVTTSSPSGNVGGGIYCGNQSGPTIANCDISGNTAVAGFSGPRPLLGLGGGLYGSNGTITDCTISGNTANGIGLLGGGRGGGLSACNGTITNCTISGNTANEAGGLGGIGGGLYACNGTIANCTIIGNTAVGTSLHGGSGGGLYACNGTITNCTISGNSTGGGFGGGLYGCNGTIINCSISGNTAASGGGLYSCNETITNCIISGNTAAGSMYGGRGGGLYEANGTITNCTISGNTATGIGGPTGDSRGGGLYGSNGTITNCIFWGNLADVGPEIDYSSDPNYSCIKDWFGGGIGNIDADPCFVDVNNDDYHLKSQAGRWETNSESWMVDDVTSPCIDTGDPMFPIGLEPFPNGGIINMGAYGGTAEASKSYFGKPPCEIIVVGDVNGDCIVNFLDFRLMALHWCEDNNP